MATERSQGPERGSVEESPPGAAVQAAKWWALPSDSDPGAPASFCPADGLPSQAPRDAPWALWSHLRPHRALGTLLGKALRGPIAPRVRLGGEYGQMGVTLRGSAQCRAWALGPSMGRFSRWGAGPRGLALCGSPASCRGSPQAEPRSRDRLQRVVVGKGAAGCGQDTWVWVTSATSQLWGLG